MTYLTSLRCTFESISMDFRQVWWRQAYRSRYWRDGAGGGGSRGLLVLLQCWDAWRCRMERKVGGERTAVLGIQPRATLATPLRVTQRRSWSAAVPNDAAVASCLKNKAISL